MEIVDIKKILVPNLLIYIYLHCVRSSLRCATMLATLIRVCSPVIHLFGWIPLCIEKLSNIWNPMHVWCGHCTALCLGIKTHGPHFLLSWKDGSFIAIIFWRILCSRAKKKKLADIQLSTAEKQRGEFSYSTTEECVFHLL